MSHRARSRRSPPAREMIELVIDELVLDGFSPSDRYAIGDALAAELEALLQQQSHPFQVPPLAGGAGTELVLNLDRLDAGPISLRTNAPAATMGVQIAGAVHGILQTVERKGIEQNRSGRSLEGKSA